MAIHTLGSERYKDLYYDPDLYENIDTENIGELIPELYPKVKRVTSLSENNSFSWLWGRIKITGKGTVKINYPFSEEHTSDFTLKSVDLSTVPYIILEAKTSGRFIGWYSLTPSGLDYISNESFLILNKYNFLDITGFEAHFND